MSTETFEIEEYRRLTKPVIDAAWHAAAMAALDSVDGIEYPGYLQPLLDAFKIYNTEVWRRAFGDDDGTP